MRVNKEFWKNVRQEIRAGSAAAHPPRRVSESRRRWAGCRRGAWSFSRTAMYEPPDDFASHFADAGWEASRCSPLHPSIPAGHPAGEILSRFDGLHVRPNTLAGSQCATSDIAFKYIAADELVAEWAARLRLHLIGVAEIAEAYGQLWVSNDDRYFTTNDVDETFAYVATGFHEMVRNLMGGVQVQPLLPPGSTSVTVYGLSLTEDDTRIYDWKTAHSDNG